MTTRVFKGLPAQMLPRATKEKEKWQHAVADRMESIGRTQFHDNLKMLENYEMTAGKLIASHYFESDSYADMINMLTQELELPNYLRHYDIIGPIIQTLSGEMQEHPDNFRIRRYDEAFTNTYIREKTRLLMRYIQEDIQLELNKALAEMGYDPQGKQTGFDSPEQQQQMAQVIEQKRRELTPPEIETYMKTKWTDISEEWGTHQLEHDNIKFNRAMKDKTEFEDLMKSAHCYRHFYVRGGQNCEETWNPITVFQETSPDMPEAEKGDFIGRHFYLTPTAALNRYGHLMTADQMKKFDPEDIEFTKSDKKGKLTGTGPNDAANIPYASIVPWINYPDYKLQTESLGDDPLNPIPALPDDFWKTVHSGQYTLDTTGLVSVTEWYHRSRRKEGYYCYLDEEIGMIRNIIVDEDFEWPEGTKIYSNEEWTKYKDTPGTLTWTWSDEIWQGIKLGKGNTRLEEDLYLGIKPCELQLEDPETGQLILPVCSAVTNARNTAPTALVDLIKSDQIGHNVSMNQLYLIMEREVGKFIIMDPNLFVRWKDWAGEGGMEKFISVAKALGITVADTSPANTKGANAGGQLPKMIDLDESARMLSRLRIANEFELAAKRRVGMSDQRMGDIGKDETATGINQGIAKSYTQTRSYFTTFFDYKRRYLRMAMDTALYVQQKNPDILLTYNKGDLTRAFFALNGQEKLSGVKLGVFVTDSQEALRQTELIRSMFMNNNNTEIAPPDLVTIITSNSPAEMKAELAKSYEQRQQLEQQKLKQQQEQFQQQQAWTRESFYAKLDNEREVAYIRTFGGINASPTQDEDQDMIPDVLEYDKLNAKLTHDQANLDIQREKNRLTEKKMDSDDRNNAANRKLKEKELKNKLAIEKDKVEIARVNKNRYSTPSRKK